MIVSYEPFAQALYYERTRRLNETIRSYSSDNHESLHRSKPKITNVNDMIDLNI